MIKVTIYQSSEGKISGFAVQGHAGYAESGSDIVCAAVSVLTQNTVNSIEEFTEDGFSVDVDEKEGGLYLKMEPGYSGKSKLLLDSLILGLQGIEEEYMDYLDVIFEEV
ncbi:MAG TPA: ribosomal-processing cysteine protease Prp [Candidatus Blautia merdigallinarum]|uniref:Ribosomal processing cysteine protease Prp n=1 Tax=Candidatus Blautia merdigallinarum TaxID=2838495 RepID=A0A9D2N772_9FIRM|nr:ribosomal-processing cysteine protease Prp [Candidatus Blautia merdigallinarum]